MQATIEKANTLEVKKPANVISFPSMLTTSHEVYNDILIFLKGKSRSSKNTAIKFEQDIREFFASDIIVGKEIENLTRADLKVKNIQVIEYRDSLIDSRKYKNSTINGKLTGMVSLYRFFKTNDYNVNPEALVVDKLPDDTKHIGYLTPDEIHYLADLALLEKNEPLMKRNLIYVAYATSIRINALLGLRLKHFRKDEEDSDKYIIEPDYLDKGKKISKEIHRSLYDSIIESLQSDDPNSLIFTISQSGALTMMKRLFEKAGLDSKRNLAFHSIRKAGADFAYEYSNGDIFTVSNQGNWGNVNTVQKNYLKQKRNIVGMAAFETVNENVFEELSHEDAIELLKSISGHSGIGSRLKKEAQELIESKG